MLPPIASLVPHRAPMILLDEALAFDDDGATCAVAVRAGAAFVEDGVVPAVVFMEYMAQAVAALAGYAAQKRGDTVGSGYVVGARELNLHVASASVGDRLVVTVRRLAGNAQLGHYRGEVRRAGELLADGELSIFHGAAAGAP